MLGEENECNDNSVMLTYTIKKGKLAVENDRYQNSNKCSHKVLRWQYKRYEIRDQHRSVGFDSNIGRNRQSNA